MDPLISSLSKILHAICGYLPKRCALRVDDSSSNSVMCELVNAAYVSLSKTVGDLVANAIRKLKMKDGEAWIIGCLCLKLVYRLEIC